MDIIRAFFNFRFSSRNGQSQQKLSKSITHFTIQFRSKNLTHFTNLSSLVIENNMLAQHCQRYFWLYKFSSKHVSIWCLFGVREDICTAAFDAQELHSWSTLKANVCILLYISVRNVLLVRFYLVGSGIGEEVGLNSFLKAALYSGLVKGFALFRFNWNFWKFNYFSAFGYFYRASSRLLLSATIAPTLVPWVLGKLFSLEMTKNYICLGGTSKQSSLFSENVPRKNASITPMSRIGPVLSVALQRWNFSDNLDFKRKIVAKFVIWSHFPSI